MTALDPQPALAEPTIEPLTPHLGAVLRGVRLSGRPDADTFARVRAALDRHLVLVLEDQALSAAELRAFTGHFGPLFLHHDDVGVIHADGLPEVLEMRKEPDDRRLFGGSDWHADVTFRKPAAWSKSIGGMSWSREGVGFVTPKGDQF